MISRQKKNQNHRRAPVGRRREKKDIEKRGSKNLNQEKKTSKWQFKGFQHNKDIKNPKPSLSANQLPPPLSPLKMPWTRASTRRDFNSFNSA